MKINTRFWRCDEETWNYGEALIPHILMNHFGCETNFDFEPGSPALMSIGSQLDRQSIDTMMGRARPVVVWGSGYTMYKPVDANNLRVDLRAVRGPLTQRVVGGDNLPMGDPGFLVSEVFTASPKRHLGPVYVPHWFNRFKSSDMRHNTDWLNLELKAGSKKAVETFLFKLLSYEFVMTNALHVAITCVAYGIPWAPVLNHNDCLDRPWKWVDVEQWLDTKFIFCRDYAQAKLWWDGFGRHIQVPDLTPLKESFPKDIAYE